MADARQALTKLLEGLGESSQFVTSGSVTPVLPGLEVTGAGTIGCPVSTADAKQLIARATQAPYGRGAETIVDTGVRRVWQLEPSQFALRNDDWSAHVAAIVEAVRKEFGIREKVSAELYKLLVYEKGSFFAPHRDSEKNAGMFATLVVCLPSRHEGGTLIVKHDGQSRKVTFGGKDSEFRTQYVAFYADCEHEIEPVTAGYRVCLVYNLASARKKQPVPPESSALVEKAAELLKQLFATPSEELAKIAVPFKHQYTEASLDPKDLKGSDRAVADVLARASESLDFQCFLALLTHHQSGGADYSTYCDRSWGRRSRWSYDDEGEDEDGDEDSGVDIAEIFDEQLSLDHWLDPRGRKQSFGTIHLQETEVLDPNSMKEWSYRQEVHEATGNEGATVERWYRQCVLVIWPRDRYFGILAREGQVQALPVLEQMVARSKKPDAVANCLRFAEEIVSHWLPRQHVMGDNSSCTGRMLKVLERVGTVELAQRCLREVLPKDFDGSEGKSICRLCQRFGWTAFAGALREFLMQQRPDNYVTELGKIVSICDPLCCDPPALTKVRGAVCVALAEELVNVIERWHIGPEHAYHRRHEKRASVVEGVVRILATVSATDHLARFVAHVLADNPDYDLYEALIPGVKGIYGWIAKVPAAHSVAARLLQHCLTELRAATATPVQPPSDWARDADLSCKCADCRMLGQFLHDPDQRVGRFPLRKDRRQHLHGQIDRQRLDVIHVTERIGSPQTLVCTKTDASYRRRLKQYNEDKQLLADLEALGGDERGIALKRPARRRLIKN